MHNVDLKFFPGWTRKAISFTIDDGNLTLDEKFLGYVKPAGILGTFNLCSNTVTEEKKAKYLELYRGYELTNHVKMHPMAIPDGWEHTVSDEKFDLATSDPSTLYKTENEGLYYRNINGRQFLVADNDAYIRLAREGREELRAVFGEGATKDFVWPYGMQKNAELFERLKKEGYRSIRKTTSVGYELPTDRNAWSYNATYEDMLEKAEYFEKMEDGGELCRFIFGVHSHDFHNAGRWDVLIDFCKRYGNRPEEFYYSTVGGIFDLEDAIAKAEVTDSGVINNSDLTLYIKVDGKRVTLFPRSEYKFETE